MEEESSPPQQNYNMRFARGWISQYLGLRVDRYRKKNENIHELQIIAYCGTAELSFTPPEMLSQREFNTVVLSRSAEAFSYYA